MMNDEWKASFQFSEKTSFVDFSFKAIEKEISLAEN
jgi:hypothetical protein